MEDFKKILSTRIKERRKAQKIPVPTILDYVDIQRSTYDGYIQGRRTPKHERLVKLAEILNTTTDYLTGKTDDKMLASSDVKDVLKNKTLTINGQPLTTDQYKILDEALNLILNQEV